MSENIEKKKEDTRICPYCHQEMEKGYIQNCWGDIRWTPKDSKRGLITNRLKKGEISLIPSRLFTKNTIEVNRCPNCQIEIIDESKADKVNVILQYVLILFIILFPICYTAWKYYMPVKLVDVTDLSIVMETKTRKYFLFGKDSCEYCRQTELNLDRIYERAMGFSKTVYYVDTEYWSKEDPEEFETICKEFEIEEVPRLIGVQNGQLYSDINVVGILSDFQEKGIMPEPTYEAIID